MDIGEAATRIRTYQRQGGEFYKTRAGRAVLLLSLRHGSDTNTLRTKLKREFSDKEYKSLVDEFIDSTLIPALG